MASLVIGFILGILGSLVAWFVAIGVVTPALDVRKEVELIRTASEPDKYRLAISNRRIFRDAHDVSIKVRCSYVTKQEIRKFFEVPVDDSWIPMIRSRWYWRRNRPQGRTRKNHWAQMPVLCRAEVSTSDSDALPKDKDGLVNIFDMLGPSYQGRISVSIIAYDSWSGTKKLFYKRFSRHNLKIVDSRDGNQRSTRESGLGWPPITNTGEQAGNESGSMAVNLDAIEFKQGILSAEAFYDGIRMDE